MQLAACTRCGERVSILYDGTLVEHAQPDNHALLCTGSRTKPDCEEANVGDRGVAMSVRKRREIVLN